MDYIIDEVESKISVSFSGDIDMISVKDIKDKLFSLSREHSKDIEIDLKNADYLDSSGIGMFLTLNKLQKEKNHKMHLVNIPDRISNILKLSSLDTTLS